jgi:FtsZ-interacting cell division protein ZipA
VRASDCHLVVHTIHTTVSEEEMSRTPKKKSRTAVKTPVSRTKAKKKTSTARSLALKNTADEVKKRSIVAKAAEELVAAPRKQSAELKRKPVAEAAVERSPLEPPVPAMGLSERPSDMASAASHSNGAAARTEKPAVIENGGVQPAPEPSADAVGPWSPLLMLIKQQTLVTATMFNIMRSQQEWIWRGGRLPWMNS